MSDCVGQWQQLQYFTKQMSIQLPQNHRKIHVTVVWWVTEEDARVPQRSYLYCLHIIKHHNCFAALFPGPPGWAGARRELLDFMVQGEINRGRHTDIRLDATPSGLTSAHLHHTPYFLRARCSSCRPTNSVKALKANHTIKHITNNKPIIITYQY